MALSVYATEAPRLSINSGNIRLTGGLAAHIYAREGQKPVKILSVVMVSQQSIFLSNIFFFFFFFFGIFILDRFIGSIQYRSSGRPSIYSNVYLIKYFLISMDVRIESSEIIVLFLFCFLFCYYFQKGTLQVVLLLLFHAVYIKF